MCTLALGRSSVVRAGKHGGRPPGTGGIFVFVQVQILYIGSFVCTPNYIRGYSNMGSSCVFLLSCQHPHASPLLSRSNLTRSFQLCTTTITNQPGAGATHQRHFLVWNSRTRFVLSRTRICLNLRLAQLVIRTRDYNVHFSHEAVNMLNASIMVRCISCLPRRQCNSTVGENTSPSPVEATPEFSHISSSSNILYDTTSGQRKRAGGEARFGSTIFWRISWCYGSCMPNEVLVVNVICFGFTVAFSGKSIFQMSHTKSSVWICRNVCLWTVYSS